MFIDIISNLMKSQIDNNYNSWKRTYEEAFKIFCKSDKVINSV